VRLASELVKLGGDFLPTVHRDHVQVGELGDSPQLGGDLYGKLPRGGQAQGLKPPGRIELLQNGQAESGRLSRARAGLAEQIVSLQRRWNQRSLNVAGFNELHFAEGLQETSLNAQIGKRLG
jgi:hypothetical protein